MTTISSAFPRFAENMEPHEIVYQLAKSGKLRQLKHYLSKRPRDERKRIVGFKYNGATSLIMACRNGHYDIVEYICESCGANLEQSGLVNFEGENIEGAPPLWCASAAGHLKIVKYLVAKVSNGHGRSNLRRQTGYFKVQKAELLKFHKLRLPKLCFCVFIGKKTELDFHFGPSEKIKINEIKISTTSWVKNWQLFFL